MNRLPMLPTRKWTEDLEKATGYTVAEMPEAGETLHGFAYDDDTLYRRRTC